MNNIKVLLIFLQLLTIDICKSQSYLNSIIPKLEEDITKFLNDSEIKNKGCIKKQIVFIGFDSIEINSLKRIDSLTLKNREVKIMFSKFIPMVENFQHCDSLSILQIIKDEENDTLINLLFVRKLHLYQKGEIVPYKEFTKYECYGNYIIVKW